MRQHDVQYRWAIRFVISGQLGFFLPLLLCLLVLPQGLLANHGFTYYGEHTQTIMLYRLAFLLAGAFTLLASLNLPEGMPFTIIRFAFRLMLLLFIAIVVTTTITNPVLNRLHDKFGVALFLIQLALDTWMALFVHRDRIYQLLLLLLLLGSLASLLALYDVIPYLIEGQMLVQLTFGLLLTHTLLHLRPRN